jgi:predicted permease
MIFPWAQRRRDRELDEELRTHLSMAIAERVARGESRREAEAAARREFGNLGVVTEVTREMWGGAAFERLWQDVRFGLRALRRSPAFTGVAGLTLALGIGATTAMFTIVHDVMVRPLPYPQSDRLVQLSYQNTGFGFGDVLGMADVHWMGFRDRARLLDGAGAWYSQLANLTGAGDPVRVRSAGVSAELFATLGVRPLHGRAFVRGDESPASSRVVMLGGGIWRERFGGDPGVVGRSVTIDGVPRTVVGVMPSGFVYPDDAQLWLPLELHPTPQFSMLVRVIGRLRAGVTIQQAAAEVTSVAGGVGTPDRGAVFRTLVVPLKDVVIGDSRRSLLVFAGAVGLVLLIACANVANLLLMRATTRHREMAVRAALGAGRRRLIRQLVTEATILWLVAGALGVTVAMAGVRALLVLAPAGRIPRQGEIGVDATALAFALGVSLVTGVLFGLVPAVRVTRGAVRDALSATARTMSGRDGPLRGALVVAEVAIAMVLLAGAGLLVQSFVRRSQVALGFRPSGLATMTVDLPEATYRSASTMQAFHRAMLERLDRVPGVAGVAAVNFIPLGGPVVVGDFSLPGGRKRPEGFLTAKLAVSPGYFRTMGTPVLAGREFTAADAASAQRVVIVSKRVAETIWPGQPAVGQEISLSDNPRAGAWLVVVGVVDDVAQQAIDGHRDAAIYQPVAQVDQSFFLSHMSFVLRATDGPERVFPAMRQALREVDRNQPVGSIGTMDATVARVIADPLFRARLIGAFSAFALVLAAIGIYGVVAYSVAERTHEIGIRAALGATRGHVVRLVLRRVIALVIPGVILGMLGAFATTRVLESLLFAVKPNDVVTFAVVAALLVGVAFVAGLVPARRASRVDPLVALRAGS